MALKEMVLNRDYLLMTKSGHNVRFVKHKPTPVHPFAVEAALAIGAVFADGSTFEPEERPKEAEPAVGFERKTALYDACVLLSERNDADDFTAGGTPKLKAIEGVLGYAVDRAEVDEAWRQHLLAKANAE